MNFSDDLEYIRKKLGPQRIPIRLLVPLSIIYSTIFVLGVFGNIITCIVIARIRFMHTATNYYLFNLSISDLLVLVLGLPHDTFSLWHHYPYPFGGTVCILKSLFSDMSMCSSVLTVSAFTIERYLAICHPIRTSNPSSLCRSIKVICLIWTLSFACTLPLSLQMGIHTEVRNDSFTNYKPRSILESALCTIMEKWQSSHSFLISFVVLFLLPLMLIVIMYVLIGLAIRRSMLRRQESENFNSVEQRTYQKVRVKKAILKMLVAIVIAFFVCFAPFHAERLMVSLIPEENWSNNDYLWRIHDVLYHVSGVFYYMNSVINPILYNLMSLKFRKAFHHVTLNLCRSNYNGAGITGNGGSGAGASKKKAAVPAAGIPICRVPLCPKKKSEEPLGTPSIVRIGTNSSIKFKPLSGQDIPLVVTKQRPAISKNINSKSVSCSGFYCYIGAAKLASQEDQFSSNCSAPNRIDSELSSDTVRQKQKKSNNSQELSTGSVKTGTPKNVATTSHGRNSLKKLDKFLKKGSFKKSEQPVLNKDAVYWNNAGGGFCRLSGRLHYFNPCHRVEMSSSSDSAGFRNGYNFSNGDYDRRVHLT